VFHEGLQSFIKIKDSKKLELLRGPKAFAAYHYLLMICPGFETRNEMGCGSTLKHFNQSDGLFSRATEARPNGGALVSLSSHWP